MRIRLKLKKISKVFARIIIACVICIGLFYALVQSETGKYYLARLLESILSRGPDRQVQIGRIQGHVPFRIQCDKITISDEATEYLVIEHILFHWRPTLRIKERIAIDELSVQEIRLIRRPTQPDVKKGFKVPTWPLGIPAFQIDRFLLQRLEIKEPVFGMNAAFSINGRSISNDPVAGLNGSIRMVRLDAPGSSYSMTWSLAGSKPLLVMDARIQEPEGGFIKAILGLKETGSVAFHLRGEGPLDNWSAHLTAGMEKIGHVESSISLKMNKALHITAEGNASPYSSTIPGILSPLITASRIPFMVDMEYGPSKKMILHQIHLDTGGSLIKGQGDFDLNRQRVTAVFHLDIKDIAAFSAFLGRPAHGNLVVKGEVSGTLQEPLVDLSVLLTQPAFDDLSARKIALDAKIMSFGTFPLDLQGLHIKGKGIMEGFLVNGKNTFLPFTFYKWNMDVNIRRGEPIALNALDIFAEDLMVHFSGIFDYDSLLIDGNANVRSSNLGWLSRMIGRGITGRAYLDTNLVVDLKALNLFAETKGRIHEMPSLPPFIEILTGGDTAFFGKIDLSKGRYLTFSDFQVHSATATMTADCSIDLLTKDTGAKASLSVPKLEVLSPLIQDEIHGSLLSNLEITGAYTAPKVIVHATGKDILFKDLDFQQVLLSLHGENLFVEPRGHLHLKTKQEDHVINASTRISLENQSIAFTESAFSISGTHITGNLEWDLRTKTAKGLFQGISNDLTTLSSLWGEQLQGSGEINVSITRGNKGQDAILNLKAKEIISRFGRAAELRASIHVKDLLGNPEGSVDMECRSFQKGPMALQTVQIQADGRLRQADVSLSASGRYLNHFEIRTHGSYLYSHEDLYFELRHLQGRYGEYPILLARPLIVHRLRESTILKDASLSLGKGVLTVSADMGPSTIRLNAQANRIPLEMLHLVGFPFLSGTADIGMSLSGRKDRPQGHMAIQIQGIRSKVKTFQDIPGADLSINIALQNSQIQGVMILSGLSEKPVRASLQIPASLSLSPFALSVSQQGEIQGMASVEWDIRQTASFFYLEDQNFNGKAVIDLKIGGTLEAPNITGNVRINDGVYENAVAGIVIKDIQVHATVVNDKLVLETAHASDGGNGRIQANGWLYFLHEKGFPFQIIVDLDNVALIHRDEVSIITDGHFVTSGSISGVNLSGNVTIGRAELRIPDRLPAEVQTLEVVEINAPFEEDKVIKKPGQKLSNEITLDLDINAPGRIFIRGRGLESEWKSNLYLKGSADDIAIIGNLSIVRGHYNFFGKLFSLTTGIIVFDGQNPPSPGFDVIAEHNRADVTTRIRLSGTLSAPILDIESDPALPTDEILSRLLFGKGVANITPFQALKLAQAINAIKGNEGGLLGFFDRTRKLLGVDQLTVNQSEETGDQAALSVGKYVREDVYVEMEKGLGEESGKIKIEVELTPYISVESKAREDLSGGIGINWKWDY